MTPFVPPPALLQAYEATVYRVHTPGEALDLRVGARHAGLTARLGGAGKHGEETVEEAERACWMVITADNPGSRLLSPTENEARREYLGQHLAALGLHCLAAENLAPAGDWPTERGFFVTGRPLDRSLALALGRQMGQNAVLFGEAGSLVELLWCLEASQAGLGHSPERPAT